MPRTARALTGGICCHVINRGNARSQVFHDVHDYASFVGLMKGACERVPMRVVGLCLMPNHFHMVLWPRADNDLARWMQWLMTSHVRRHHRRYGTSGHIWQGRFKSFPVQSDAHLWTVVRYVERNPIRAGLAVGAEDWRWSSLRWMTVRDEAPVFWDADVLKRPKEWLREVNEPQTEAELTALRRSVNRGTPFGNEAWTLRTAAQLGSTSSLRPRGRPSKSMEK
jgi:putative transposase